MNNILKNKYDNLCKYLREMGSFIIAFSGGIDSILLSYISGEMLKLDILLITVNTNTQDEIDLSDALYFSKEYKLDHKIIYASTLEMNDFINNTDEKCYICKKKMFEEIKRYNKNRYKYILDGSNLDDLNEFRPGRRAANEYKIISPFIDSNITKSDIYELGRYFDIRNKNKKSNSCLATRVKKGNIITEKNLYMIKKAEDYLKKFNFNILRVRYDKLDAIIEVDKSEIYIIEENIYEIKKKLNDIGFINISYDKEGYKK